MQTKKSQTIKKQLQKLLKRLLTHLEEWGTAAAQAKRI